MRISDWSSDVCSSDLVVAAGAAQSTADDAVQLALGNDGRAFCSRGAGENSVRCGANTKEDVTAANGIGIGTDAQALADGGIAVGHNATAVQANRSEEHTSELQSLMRISYAVFCLKKQKRKQELTTTKQ